MKTTCSCHAMPRGRRWRIACTASVVFTIFFGLWMMFNPAGPKATTWVDDLGTLLVASLVVTGSALKARTSSGRGRAGWIWIAAAATSWTLGEGIWSWYAVVRAEPVPSPSIADVAYLLAVPLAVVGLALLSANPGQITTAFRSVCDGLIIAGSLLFISWSTALGVVYRVGGGSTLARIVDISYPVTDIVLCTAALSGLSRVARLRRRELGLIGLGLLAFAVADSAYTYFSYTNSYGNGTIFDTGYIVGYLLIFLATLAPVASNRPESTGRELSTSQTMLPYVPLGIAVGVTVARAMTGGRFDVLLVTTGTVTVSLVLVRQLLTVVENSRLARSLQSTVGELRERESELAYQASHDPLTGLANRILFADRVDQALLRRERSGGIVALDGLRPRRLQGGQRHDGPPRRRRGSPRGCGKAEVLHAQGGHDRPARRRRVRSAPGGSGPDRNRARDRDSHQRGAAAGPHDRRHACPHELQRRHSDGL